MQKNPVHTIQTSPARQKWSFKAVVLLFAFLASTYCFSAQATAYEDLFNTYLNPLPRNQGESHDDYWERVNEFLGLTTRERIPFGLPGCAGRCSSGLRPSNNNFFFYSMFDVLFTAQKNRRPGELFPLQYLPKMRDAWDNLVRGMEESGIRLDNLNQPDKAAAFADLMISLRDYAVEGLPELNNPEANTDSLLASFDEGWRSNLVESNIPRFTAKIPDSGDEFLAWLKQNNDYFDYGNSANAKNWFPDHTEFQEYWAIQEKRFDADFDKPGFSKRLFWVDNDGLPGDRIMRVQMSPAFSDSLHIDSSGAAIRNPAAKVTKLKSEMGGIISDLFSDPLPRQPHLAYKEFLVRMNILNNFHILNNGNGRVYTLLLQYFSITEGWPPTYLKNELNTYTDRIASIDTVIEESVTTNLQEGIEQTKRINRSCRG